MRHELLRQLAALEAEHQTITFETFRPGSARRKYPPYPPGVMEHLRKLRQDGLIEFDPKAKPRVQAPITLTAAGREEAARPYVVEVMLNEPGPGEKTVTFHLNTGEVQTERAEDLTWKAIRRRAERSARILFTRHDFEGPRRRRQPQNGGGTDRTNDFLAQFLGPDHEYGGGTDRTNDFLAQFLGPDHEYGDRIHEDQPADLPPTTTPQPHRTARHLSYRAAAAWPGKHLAVRGPYDAAWVEASQRIPGCRWSEHDQASLFPVESYHPLLQVLQEWPLHNALSPEDVREIGAILAVYARRPASP